VASTAPSRAASAARAPAVPAAVRPPVERKPQKSVLASRAPAMPAKSRAPVARQRQEPVLQATQRRRAVAAQPAMADAGDWETF